MFKRTAKKGFTLIELMIVIAILGVLAAVAIPQYMNYVGSSKERAVKSNHDSAVKMIKAEFSKKTATERASNDITVELIDLAGKNNRNPFTPADPAFAATQASVGQVIISVVNINGMTAGTSTIINGQYYTPGNATPQQLPIVNLTFE